MGKTPWDLAAVLSVISKSDNAKYLEAVATPSQLSDFRFGLVRDAHPCTKDIDPSGGDLRTECEAFYESIIRQLEPTIDQVECEAVDQMLNFDGSIGWDDNGRWIGIPDDLIVFDRFADDFKTYLQTHRPDSEIKTLSDLVQWNKLHPVGSTSVRELTHRRELFIPPE